MQDWRREWLAVLRHERVVGHWCLRGIWCLAWIAAGCVGLQWRLAISVGGLPAYAAALVVSVVACALAVALKSIHDTAHAFDQDLGAPCPVKRKLWFKDWKD